MNIFEPDILRSFFHRNFEFFACVVFFASLAFTYYVIPKIIWVVKSKRLTKEVNSRSAHSGNIASFGGVAFFATFLLSMACLQAVDVRAVSAQLIAAATLMFMVGLKDDLVVSTAKVKFIGQLAATAFIIFSPELQIDNLYGFLGIHEIPQILGYAFAAFLVLALINSYNLIDGINGLAGIIGLIVSLVYAYVFYVNHEYLFVPICLTLAGSLIAFLRFNLARPTRRIFMGDSGSLIVGLILGFLTLRILALPEDSIWLQGQALLDNRVLWITAILFIPMFDTTRVMIYRKLKGKGMFSPDKNHCHHILLKRNLTHTQASLTLGGINIIVILLVSVLILLLNGHLFWLHLAVLLVYAIVWILFYSLNRNQTSLKSIVA